MNIIDEQLLNRPVSAVTLDGRVSGMVQHWNRNPTYGICLTLPDGRVYWPNEVTDVRLCTKVEARHARGL